LASNFLDASGNKNLGVPLSFRNDMIGLRIVLALSIRQPCRWV